MHHTAFYQPTLRGLDLGSYNQMFAYAQYRALPGQDARFPIADRHPIE